MYHSYNTEKRNAEHNVIIEMQKCKLMVRCQIIIPILALKKGT